MLKFNELGLSPNMIKGIEELGFVNPTPIQEEIIPILYNTTDDAIGLAQTGTGKTAAFGIPIIDLIEEDKKYAQALILSPTRELCIQIAKDLETYAKYFKKVNIVAVYGGASIEPQISSLRRGAQIIVATPGRMLDLLKRRSADIKNINTVVLDEADEMLNMGFKEDLNAILEKTPQTKRTLLFSATMSREVAKIADNYLNNPKKVTIGKQNSGAQNIKHIYYQVHAKDRYLALKRIADINTEIYGIVFCRTRRETKEVADKLIKDGYSADALHGDLSQSQRDHVMDRFRNRSLQMLVATDVAARGIDVDDITHVINYNLPDEMEIYTHRTGRTGRADKSGVAISIVNYREKSKIPQIEKLIGKKCEKASVPDGKEICEKQLFNLIDRVEKVEVDYTHVEEFLPTIYKKLEWMDRTELIQRFVSIEFNRFLDYYKNLPELNVPTGKSERGVKTSVKRAGNYNRFFINLGNRDGLNPVTMIGMIKDHSGVKSIDIGDIEIMKNFAFFEADANYSKEILSGFSGLKVKGREVNVETAEKKKNDGDRRSFSGKRNKSKGKFRRDDKPKSRDSKKRKSRK